MLRRAGPPPIAAGGGTDHSPAKLRKQQRGLTPRNLPPRYLTKSWALFHQHSHTYTHTMTTSSNSTHSKPLQFVSILNPSLSVSLLNDFHPFIRSNFQPRTRSGLIFTGESRTKQSFKDECDINVIMRRYQQTGILDHVRDAVPQYLDATAIEFQAAMDIVAQAQTIFEELPSAIRARFENDPAQLLEFVHDPANAVEAVAMGFLDPAKVPPHLLGSTASPDASRAAAGVPPAAATPSAAGEGGKGA